MSEFFPAVAQPVRYAGPDSTDPLTFRWYDADRMIRGRRLADHLRFAVSSWHALDCMGTPKGCAGARAQTSAATPVDPMVLAAMRMDAAFEILEKLTVPYWCFHDRDLAPDGDTFKQSCANLDVMVDKAAEHMERTGLRLLWGTADLFTHPRYRSGAATSPDPEVFAYAAAQVAHCLEATHRLGGENFMLWGGRQSYETRRRVRPSRKSAMLHTDLVRALDQVGRFLALVVEHKHRIGFDGPILMQPLPLDAGSPLHDFEAGARLAVLQRYDILDDVRVNIEVRPSIPTGNDFAHEIAAAAATGLLGSVDAGALGDDIGGGTGRFPVSVEQMALGMYEILRAGGLTTGGINFDARRPGGSQDLMELFEAHVRGMDTMARALLAAGALVDDDVVESARREHYDRWGGELGRSLLAGDLDLQHLHERGMGIIESPPVPRDQTRADNLLARYVYRAA